jgi:hypothetical protein
VPLATTPITPADDPRWPMSFEISMAVRRDDPEFLQRINAVLIRERPAIEAILERYHIPLEGEGRYKKFATSSRVDGSRSVSNPMTLLQRPTAPAAP